ncbi:DUF317 domain-containing protein [Streptomyces sp. NPDC020096]
MHETIEQALISPRYLASGGDPAWVTVPLHRACGWSYGHDPLMPRVLLASPDQQALLRLDPHPDQHWWTIQHHRTTTSPAWSASFGARTPVEIIAAFTDALTHPATTAASLPADPYVPLRQAGWRRQDEHPGGFVSPDGIARVEHFADGSVNSWFIDVAISQDPEGLVWRAYFDGTTPPHLITAFTRALADDTPLPRDPLHVPALGGRRIRGTTHHVPASTVAFALERRVKDLGTRSASPCTPQPRTPHASQPHRAR